jgi:hypothetical protein
MSGNAGLQRTSMRPRSIRRSRYLIDLPDSCRSRMSRSGQHRPNAAMTADNVVTFGAGDHGACSCEPNRYQAVPPQRAIGVGNILGNSNSPTVLRP